MCREASRTPAGAAKMSHIVQTSKMHGIAPTEAPSITEFYLDTTISSRRLRLNSPPIHVRGGCFTTLCHVPTTSPFQNLAKVQHEQYLSLTFSSIGTHCSLRLRPCPYIGIGQSGSLRPSSASSSYTQGSMWQYKRIAQMNQQQ